MSEGDGLRILDSGGAGVAPGGEEDERIFWGEDPAERREATDGLAWSGAKALVARGVPSTAMSNGWRRVRATDYYVLGLTAKNTMLRGVRQ